MAAQEAEQNPDVQCDTCYLEEKEMITIYGKKQCSSCEQAKRVLESRGLAYEYKQLDQDFTMEDLMDLLENMGMLGFRSFPLIVQDGKGYTFATIDKIK